jgi:hypothetical protein
MIKDVFGALGASTRRLFKKWPALLLAVALYAALIGCGWLFFSTRVATVLQVVATLAAPVLAVILFFVLQTMLARFSIEDRAFRLLGTSLKRFWAVLLISLPLIAIAAAVIYFSGEITDSFKPAVQQTARNIPARLRNVARPATQSTPWQVTLVTTIQYILLLVALPLAAISLWGSTARDGLGTALRKSGRTLARAFGPRSVLVYAIGFLFFGLIPYQLIFTATHANNPWVEAGLLAARLMLAWLLSLIGWAVTVGAIAELKRTTVEAGLSREAEHAPA